MVKYCISIETLGLSVDHLGIDKHFPIDEQPIILQPCSLLRAVAFHLQIEIVLDQTNLVQKQCKNQVIKMLS